MQAREKYCIKLYVDNTKMKNIDSHDVSEVLKIIFVFFQLIINYSIIIEDQFHYLYSMP
jgi:hypothetical protein